MTGSTLSSGCSGTLLVPNISHEVIFELIYVLKKDGTKDIVTINAMNILKDLSNPYVNHRYH